MSDPRERGRSKHWIALNRVLDEELPKVIGSVFLSNEMLNALANAIAWIVAASTPDGAQHRILREIFEQIKKVENEHRQNIDDHRLMRSGRPPPSH